MFQVLIADDEASVRESLIRSIEWESLGLEIAACASDGNEVLEIVNRRQIDIAILDIRMPGMSGLELCEYLRKQQENIQLIIISGYAEFSYAERAIRYGVLGYCLKPLEYEKIRMLLVKAANNLEKESTTGGSDLLDALEDRNYEQAEQILYRNRISSNRYFVIVSVGETLLPLSLKDGLTVEFGRGQYGYISGTEISKEKLAEWSSMAGVCGIGYESSCVSIDSLLSTLHDCTVRAYQYFVNPEIILSCEQYEEKANEMLHAISYHVERGNWDVVMEQLNLIKEKYRTGFTVRSCMKLCNTIYSGELFREETNDYYIYNFKQLVTDYHSFSEVLDFLREQIKTVNSSTDGEEKYTNSAFMQLMGYISENYKKEISLASAGEALHMNPNYVSQLFKKEAGITFIHYITQLRMEDAIRLLTTTKMPIVDIATEVGFNDYFYFMKTFKKFTSKTPSQYRKEM